jgi:regulator of RNase E activity RraA
MTAAAAPTGDDRFAGLDSCILSDALDALGLPGAVAGIQPGRRAERHLGAQALDQAEPGDVVVVHQEGTEHAPPEAACWGGLLAQAAVLRGVAGVVVDGACRDVDEIRTVGLPVHARAVVPRTARRRYVETAVGADVVIGGVPVACGDYVLADGSGAVFVPASRLDDLLARARRMLAREQLMIQDLRAGAAVSDVLGRDYEKILDDD